MLFWVHSVHLLQNWYDQTFVQCFYYDSIIISTTVVKPNVMDLWTHGPLVYILIRCKERRFFTDGRWTMMNDGRPHHNENATIRKILKIFKFLDTGPYGSFFKTQPFLATCVLPLVSFFRCLFINGKIVPWK